MESGPGGARFVEPCSARIRWGGITESPDHEITRKPEDAVFVCPHCGAVITDRERAKALWPPHLGGTGRFESLLEPEVAAKRKYVGLKINGLCDPFIKVQDFALEWVNAKTPQKLQTFFNKRLGEAFVESQVVLTEDAVAQVMKYEPGKSIVVPSGAAYLVAGGDVQAPRHFPSIYGIAGAFTTDGHLYIVDMRILSGFQAWHAWLAKVHAVRADANGNAMVGVGEHLACRLATIDAGYETGEVLSSCRATVFAEHGRGSRVGFVPVRFQPTLNHDNPAVMAPDRKREHPTRKELGLLDYFYLHRHSWVDRAVRRVVEKRLTVLCQPAHNFREHLMSNVLRPRPKQHGMDREQLEWYKPDELRDDWLMALAFLEAGAALMLRLDSHSALVNTEAAPRGEAEKKPGWMNRHRGGGSWFGR